MKSQKPCGETFVTSTREVRRPSAPDFIHVLLDQFLSFRKSLRFEAIVRVQLDRGFDPEFGLARGMLHMHMRVGFLARKKK